MTHTGICPVCGAEGPSEVIYCEACGARLGGLPALEEEWGAAFCEKCSRVYPREAAHCDVCGALLIEFGERRRQALVLANSQGHEIRLDGESRTFGRNDFAGWISSDKARFISRQHFRVVYEGGGYWIEHVSTTNPTHLNGIPLQSRQPLKDADVIDVAGGQLRLTAQLAP